MNKQFDVFYDQTSKGFTNVLKFLLVQDPIKVAVGMALGLSVKTLFTHLTDELVKPLVHIIIGFISKSGLNFSIFGQTFGIGNVVEQSIIFILFLSLLFFGFVNPIDKLRAKYNLDQKTSACPYCRTLINPEATRCPACTSQLKT